jgi:rubrerythrin
LFSTTEILDLAIRIEKNGEAVYRQAAEKMSNPELASLLTWMADEEAKHAGWFANLKSQLATASINPFLEQMSHSLFDDLLGEKNFSHKDVDFDRIQTVGEMMDIFIEFEKDSILFFEVLEPFIEDETTLENLKKIIAEENSHITKLQQFIGNEIAIS